MDLNTSLSELPGVGPNFAKKLKKLELLTVEDLIYYYPFRYDDYSKIISVSQIKVGETATIRGAVWSIGNVYTRTRKTITKALVNDDSGSLEVVWFNQPWLTKQIKTGDKLQVSGKADKYNYRVTLVSPSWEKLGEAKNEHLHTGRLVPIYFETAGLTSKWMRNLMGKALPLVLPQIKDPLPPNITKDMLNLALALSQIHFPQNSQLLEQARERLAFDELFFLQLASQKRRLEWQNRPIIRPWVINQQELSKFIHSLPFILTQSQQKVLDEIIQDVQKDFPMNRLLQGEVGSGKTVVAAVLIYLAHLNGLKSVLMAPTEILAFQHYQTLSQLLTACKIEVGIYTGSKKFTKNKKSRIKNQGAEKLDSLSLSLDSIPDVIIGTHALLSNKLNLTDVGLVVVDEQQRFGVEQRSWLRQAAKLPHFLTMTATPIPRTVALTLHGDLDISIIDELPKGRKIVKTYFVPQHKRAAAYKFIADKINLGQQVYIITPLIEESETLVSVRAAKSEHERLQQQVFPQFKLGLLHGKLKSKDKEQVINDFKDKKTNMLVSTSVVEVGMDIPNATIMVVEGAERFGLAQLHQLRGRVGRGDQQSYAFLFSEEETLAVVRRLRSLEKIHDGLTVAELDLKIRGEGEVFGIKQSGKWKLKIASLTDLPKITKAKQAAQQLLATDPNLDKHPLLASKLSVEADTSIMPD